MESDSNPIVSVIIPFFNREDLTLISIASILNQSLQDFEIILVNDGSTEPIEKIYALTDSRIHLFHQSNKGPAAARNLGLRNAKGKYIAFLDSDDLFFPDKLKHQVEIHESNPDIWLSHTSYQKIDITGKILGIINSGTFTGNVYPDIFTFCPIATPTVMISRKVIENSILYEEQYKIAEDIIFYAKIARQTKIYGIDIPLSSIRITEDSHSTNYEAQIIGFNNILNFITSDQRELTNSQYKYVRGKIHQSLAYSYFNKFNKNNFQRFLINSFQSIFFSKQKWKTALIYIRIILLTLCKKLGIYKKNK